jgi:release factor H-coupled RctB family protein
MTVKIVSGPKSWIEGAAIAQLEHVAKLPNVEDTFGMPDLHPGPGQPIGMCCTTRERVYPHLIGSDIGCGIALWKTSIRPVKPDKLAKKLKHLQRGVNEPDTWLRLGNVKPSGHEHSLGTIGEGNHFAELLVPDGVLDPARYEEITQDANSLLMVHSGSRGYGKQILYEHTSEWQDRGLASNSTNEHEAAAYREYMERHNHAMAWAELNREVIATRMLEMMGGGGARLFDVPHNFLEGCVASITITSPTLEAVQTGAKHETTCEANLRWYHRKGAIPSNRGPVVIPGSRDAHSYLVEPLGNDAGTGYSLSHGAGRKMSRRDARIKFNDVQNSIKLLQRTRFNSVLVCYNRHTLMEEAGIAYKPIERVIQDLIDHDLIRVIAMLKPVITYKISREDLIHNNRDDLDHGC